MRVLGRVSFPLDSSTMFVSLLEEMSIIFGREETLCGETKGKSVTSVSVQVTGSSAVDLGVNSTRDRSMKNSSCFDAKL